MGDNYRFMLNCHIKELEELKVLIYSDKVTTVVAYTILLDIIGHCNKYIKQDALDLLSSYKVDGDKLSRLSDGKYVRVKNKRLLKDIDKIISLNRD